MPGGPGRVAAKGSDVMRSLWLTVALIPALACAEPRGKVEMVQGSPMTTLLPPDAIPAISDPAFVTAEEADAFLADDEPVLGLVHEGVAKAYSIWQLDRHEIVNDRIGADRNIDSTVDRLVRHVPSMYLTFALNTAFIPLLQAFGTDDGQHGRKG